MRLAVLIPVKRFGAAKGRLTGALEPLRRAELARWMATQVTTAVAEVPTFVACDDADVGAWATEQGATVVWAAGLGLNGAVDDGTTTIRSLGFDHVIVAHADLPRPQRLLDVAVDDTVTLVPDRRHDGTNVMSFPTAQPILASYGAGSFGRHFAQAADLASVAVEVRADVELSLDLDTPHDLAHPLIQQVLPSWLRTTPVNR